MLDAVVVGGGPAGLAAATWLARYRKQVAVIDSGAYRNRWVEQAHGYLGSDPVNPRELLDGARHDVAAYDETIIRPGTVERAALQADGSFELVLGDGERLAARRLVL